MGRRWGIFGFAEGKMGRTFAIAIVQLGSFCLSLVSCTPIDSSTPSANPWRHLPLLSWRTLGDCG